MKAPRWRTLALLVLGSAIVALAVGLRRNGSGWGLPIPGGFAISGHPDEWFVLDSLRAMQPGRGDLLSKEAYVEGPLQHMLWALILPVAKRLGLIERTPDEFGGKDAEVRAQRAQVLVVLRASVVAVDVVAIVVLLLAGARLFGAAAALAAALVYAVLPAFVVHAHYARTHALANLLLVLVALTCLSIERRWRATRARSLPLWCACGALTALAAATRYHMLSVGLFPAMLVLQWWLASAVPLRDRLVAPAAALASFGGALVLGIPALVVDRPLLRAGLAYTASFAQKSEFTPASLWSLDRVWTYLTWLIPVGTYPALWLVLYSAVVAALLMSIKRRALVAMALPLYAIIYLYLTAKGYAQPVFVRAAMPLLAAAVLALAYVVQALGRRSTQAIALAAIVAACVPSARYAWAYGNGMSDADPRYQAAAWIKKHIPRTTQVGILSPYPWYFTPPIKNPIVTNALTRTPLPEWLVVSSFEAHGANTISTEFTLRQEFRTLPHIGRRRCYDLARWPDDWMYPFPTVWVLQRR